MAVNNSLQARGRQTLSAYLSQDAVKSKINEVIGGKDGQRFISAIVSATTANPALQECTNSSILSAAMLGESLKLSTIATAWAVLPCAIQRQEQRQGGTVPAGLQRLYSAGNPFGAVQEIECAGDQGRRADPESIR